MLKPNFTLTVAFESDMDLPMTVHFCGKEKCKPCHTFGPAMRNVYLIHYILSGRGSYTIGDETRELHAGDGFIIPPFVPTVYSADKDDPWEYCWIAFSGPTVKDMLAKFSHSSGDFIIHSDNISGLNALFDQAMTCYFNENNIYALLGYLYLIMSNFTANDYKKDSTFAKLTDYIARNYMKPVSMDELCAAVNLSHPQIYRIFKEHSQQSPSEYIMSFRLARAQELLADTNADITDISFSCGFNSTAYFSKMFRRATGSTPTHYRKTAKKTFTSTLL